MAKTSFAQGNSGRQTKLYAVCAIALVGFALGFLIGGHSTQDEGIVIPTRDGAMERNMISEQEAIRLAEEWLQQRDMQFEGREIVVHCEGTYTISFLLPDGMLGGDWTLGIDATTGEVLGATIEV